MQKFEASYFSGKSKYLRFLGWAHTQLEVPESELSKEICSNKNVSGNVPKEPTFKNWFKKRARSRIDEHKESCKRKIRPSAYPEIDKMVLNYINTCYASVVG